MNITENGDEKCLHAQLLFMFCHFLVALRAINLTVLTLHFSDKILSLEGLINNTKTGEVRFQVLTVVSAKKAVYWDAVLCSQI
jgi:hypothetical protein